MIVSSTFVTACSLFGFKSLASFLYLISIPVLQTLSASDSVAETLCFLMLGLQVVYNIA